MKLSNEELDSILAKAGLELAQPYDEKGKYLKGQYLFTHCTTCGTQAHYRLDRVGEHRGDPDHAHPSHDRFSSAVRVLTR